jgi:hypothetical protein
VINNIVKLHVESMARLEHVVRVGHRVASIGGGIDEEPPTPAPPTLPAPPVFAPSADDVDDTLRHHFDDPEAIYGQDLVPYPDLLVRAAESGLYDTVEELLQNTSPDAKDQEGNTPLIAAISVRAFHTDAVEKERIRIVELLLDRGADPNLMSDAGHAPLVIAAHNAKEDAIRMLLERNVDPNTRSANGESALDQAKFFANAEVADMLKAYGAIS